jgi:hypothetical protein
MRISDMKEWVSDVSSLYFCFDNAGCFNVNRESSQYFGT